jgi:hypothetical protein
MPGNFKDHDFSSASGKGDKDHPEGVSLLVQGTRSDSDDFNLVEKH